MEEVVKLLRLEVSKVKPHITLGEGSVFILYKPLIKWSED